jgi:hypothetical protein
MINYANNFKIKSCVLNFFYGMLINNTQIIIVNVVGFNLEAIYVFFFLYYTLNKVNLINTRSLKLIFSKFKLQ